MNMDLAFGIFSIIINVFVGAFGLMKTLNEILTVYGQLRKLRNEVKLQELEIQLKQKTLESQEKNTKIIIP